MRLSVVMDVLCYERGREYEGWVVAVGVMRFCCR